MSRGGTAEEEREASSAGPECGSELFQTAPPHPPQVGNGTAACIKRICDAGSCNHKQLVMIEPTCNGIKVTQECYTYKWIYAFWITQNTLEAIGCQISETLYLKLIKNE